MKNNFNKIWLNIKSRTTPAYFNILHSDYKSTEVTPESDQDSESFEIYGSGNAITERGAISHTIQIIGECPDEAFLQELEAIHKAKGNLEPCDFIVQYFLNEATPPTTQTAYSDGSTLSVNALSFGEAGGKHQFDITLTSGATVAVGVPFEETPVISPVE